MRLGIVEGMRKTDLAPLQIHLSPNEFPKPTRQMRRVVPKSQPVEESKLPNPLLVSAGMGPVAMTGYVIASCFNAGQDEKQKQ